MKLSLYQIDAFAEKPFEGNPAAVCPLEEWLADELMQSIAMENNLSETAFFVPGEKGYHIRWFTPATEVDLCGHATLASAYVLFDLLGYEENEIQFDSKSGLLKVARKDGWLIMDLPAQPPTPCNMPETIVKAFSKEPARCLKSEDYLVLFNREEEILSAVPEMAHLLDLDLRGVIISAPSMHYDFVSRFFAPKVGVPEDPVTGSSFTQLAPYWSEKLGKTKLSARQVSARGGDVFCELAGDRVLISGKAVTYLVGEIEVNV